jgi:hypothetical protein
VYVNPCLAMIDLSRPTIAVSVQVPCIPNVGRDYIAYLYDADSFNKAFAIVLSQRSEFIICTLALTDSPWDGQLLHHAHLAW